MSPTTIVDRVTEDPDIPAPTHQRHPEANRCTFCGLQRSEHGVQFIHRFIPAGQHIITP